MKKYVSLTNFPPFPCKNPTPAQSTCSHILADAFPAPALKAKKALAEQLQLAGYEFNDLTVLRIEQGTRFVPD